MSLKVLKSEDIIELVPYECAARLNADDYFCDITVVVADEGNVEATIKKMQALQSEKGGKVGLAVVVLQIVADDEYPEQAFGPLTLFPAFQIVEVRELNIGPNGTNKSSRKVARKIVTVIKSFAIAGVCTDFIPVSPVLVPIPASQHKYGDGVILNQVNFKTYECEADEPDTQVASPIATQVNATVVLTSVTAGAAIYYTTDGSYPSKQNKSLLYGNPIPIPAGGFKLRSCAYLSPMVASYVQEDEIT